MNQLQGIEVDFENIESFPFDACEAVYLLACEWGEYNVITYLEKVQKFKPAPGLRCANDLTEEGRTIYRLLDKEYFRQLHTGEVSAASWRSMSDVFPEGYAL